VRRARHAAAGVKTLHTMDSDGEGEKQRSKIDAIYELRDAVETKVRAEQEFEASASPDARDALLAAQLDLEAKTQDAIDVCHECGHSHTEDAPHVTTAPVSSRHDNVVHVDFRRESESA
jgi:hypothetical protein